MELVLEVLSRNGKVKDFYQINKHEVNIGRAYDNDIVLNDPFVCPHHLTLCVDDSQVRLLDKGSINGIKTPQNRPLAKDTAVSLNQVFMLGNQLMRVVSSQSQVMSNSIKMTALEYFSQNSNRWYWALLSVIAACVVMVIDSYLGKYSEINWSKLLIDSGLKPSFFIIVIGMILAIAATLFKKEVKFFCSLLVVALGFVLFKLGFVIVGMVSFNLGDGFWVFSLNKVLLFAMFFSFLWGTLFFSTHLTMKKISLISIAFVLSGQVIHHLYQTSGDKVNLYPKYTVSVFPDSYLVKPALTSANWVEKSKSIYSKSREDAARRNEDK